MRIVLEDGTEYAQRAKLLFSDLTVDEATGQVTLRAEVPNPRGDLLPGLYVRIRAEQADVSNAIAVPQQAVELSRDYLAPAVDSIGKASEREMLVKELRRDMAAAILRRVDAASKAVVVP